MSHKIEFFQGEDKRFSYKFGPDQIGHVDEAIIKLHKSEYEAFVKQFEAEELAKERAAPDVVEEEIERGYV